MSAADKDLSPPGAGLAALRLERERLQRELTQARAELEDFTHSVSHDLRASLRHVNAYVQIICEEMGEQADAAIAAHLDTVSQAARQMGLQIDGLMALSQLTRLELQLASVDGGQLAREVCTDLSSAGTGSIASATTALSARSATIGL